MVEKGLFMYNKKDIEIIYQFQMIYGYYLKADILPILEKNYRGIDITWGSMDLRIETQGGKYQGIVIEVKMDSIKCYKVDREHDNEEIYYWLKGGIVSYRGEQYCDDLSEFTMLRSGVLEPMLNKLKNLKQSGTLTDYYIEQHIYEDTGYSKRELNKWISSIENFAQDIERYYDVEVDVEKFYYYTYEFYYYGRVAKITINLPNGESFLMDYNQLEDKVKLVTTDPDNLDGLDELLSVGYRVHKTKGYTIYDRRALEKGVREYNEEMGNKLKILEKMERRRSK